MENSNTLRYRVAMKKGRRLFNMTAGSLMILGGSAVVVLTVIVCIRTKYGFLSNLAEYHVHRSYAPHGRGDFIMSDLKIKSIVSTIKTPFLIGTQVEMLIRELKNKHV